MSCAYCGCDPEKDTLQEAVTKLLGCNNCRADIHLAGQWTGKGIAALRALVEKHGQEAVVVEWDSRTPKKAKKNKQEGKP